MPVDFQYFGVARETMDTAITEFVFAGENSQPVRRKGITLRFAGTGPHDRSGRKPSLGWLLAASGIKEPIL